MITVFFIISFALFAGVAFFYWRRILQARVRSLGASFIKLIATFRRYMDHVSGVLSQLSETLPEQVYQELNARFENAQALLGTLPAQPTKQDVEELFVAIGNLCAGLKESYTVTAEGLDATDEEAYEQLALWTTHWQVMGQGADMYNEEALSLYELARTFQGRVICWAMGIRSPIFFDTSIFATLPDLSTADEDKLVTGELNYYPGQDQSEQESVGGYAQQKSLIAAWRAKRKKKKDNIREQAQEGAIIHDDEERYYSS